MATFWGPLGQTNWSVLDTTWSSQEDEYQQLNMFFDVISC